MFIIYYLTYLFLFRVVLTEKFKSIKAVEDDFYHNVIEAKYTEEVTRRCEAEAEACNFIKKENLAQMFTCEFCEISKNTFSYKTPPAAVS